LGPFPNPAAKQGEPEAAVRDVALRKQLDLEAVGPRQTPGGDRDAPRKNGLERALGRQLLDHGRLEIGELGGILLRQRHVLLGAQAVLERIPRRAGLAFGCLRAARPGTVPAARLDAGSGRGIGRARRLPGRVGAGCPPCRT
jgi:hypothetical protein